MPYVGLGGHPDVLSRYGDTAARGLLARMQRVPLAQRTAALKAVMAKIDTTLQARTERYAAEAKRSGVPRAKALEVGLSRALTEGAVAQLAKVGRTGSLSGLGSLANMVTEIYGGVAHKPAATEIQVGPFRFPVDTKEAYAIIYKTPAELKALSEDKKAFIRQALLKGAGDDGPWRRVAMNAPYPGGQKPGPNAFKCPWVQALGLSCDQVLAGEMLTSTLTDITYDRIADHKVSPIATFQHPTSGNDWGIFLTVKKDASVGYPAGFYLQFHWIPEANWWHKLGRFVKRLPGNIVAAEFAVGGAVKDAAEWIGDKFCEMACNPNAQQALLTSGDPRAAGGALAARAACRCPGAVTPPVASSSNTLLYVLLGGGALLAAIALTQE